MISKHKASFKEFEIPNIHMLKGRKEKFHKCHGMSKQSIQNVRETNGRKGPFLYISGSLGKREKMAVFAYEIPQGLISFLLQIK